MGRHAIGSSPLRTPAVLVGVPVATVLATWSTTAVLGGVVPSAEEAPLRAEAPGEVVAGPQAAVPQGAPSAPAMSFDTSLLPSADAASGSWARTTPTAAVTSAADGRPTVGPRVVRVAPAVAPTPAEGPRVLEADDERGDDDVTSTAVTSVDAIPADVIPADVPAPRRAAEPRLRPRAVTAASPVETVSSRSSDGTDHADRTDADGPVLDLDSPSGGLSVLTFG